MTGLENGEVYTFKILSGEEIVGKVVTSGDGVVVLSNPLSVAPSGGGMGLIPSLFTSDQDKNIELNTNAVAMWAPSAEGIRVKYIEATTGITTASKKIVLG